MNFSQALVEFGDALRRKNPFAIGLVVVVVLLLLALLVGPGTVINLLTILVPFWLTAVIYCICYFILVAEYRKRHPEFTPTQGKVMASAITIALMILIVALSR